MIAATSNARRSRSTHTHSLVRSNTNVQVITAITARRRGNTARISAKMKAGILCLLMKENLRVPTDVRQRNHQNSNDAVTEIQKPAADFQFPAKVAHDRKNHRSVQERGRVRSLPLERE